MTEHEHHGNNSNRYTWITRKPHTPSLELHDMRSMILIISDINGFLP